MSVLQGDLFASGTTELHPSPTFERLPLDDAGGSWVDVARGWLQGADALLETLVAAVPWKQGRRRMYDRTVDDPRLSRWYRRDDPLPDPVLGEIRSHLTKRYRKPFGSVGLNYYRDGRDSVAPHSDRELRDLDDALVAIVTTGAARPFLIRPQAGGPSLDVRPGSGDLLVMGGRCQVDHHHGVPKVASAGPRVSISLRWCARPDVAPGGPPSS